MASILDEFLILFKPTVKGNGLTKLNRDLKQTHSNLFSMKNLFSAFIGYDIYSGLKAIGGSLIDASREMGAMRSRFFAITQDEKKANEELEWAFNLAQKTAMPMKALADSYSIFFAATQKGLGTSGAREVFQDWTEVSRVLHLSEYQFERVTYALREMASKGAIYSQDLRMQIGTHVPNAIGLAQKAAEDLGITGSNWFETLQEKAKGNQKLINQFITLFSKHAKDMYADPIAMEKALKQPDAQIIRLRQQWDKLRYAMVESGFQDDLLKVLGKLNDTLDKITSHAKELYDVIKAISMVFIGLFGLKAFKSLSKFITKIGIFFKGVGKFFGKTKTAINGFFALVKRHGFKHVGKFFGKFALRNLLRLGLVGIAQFIPVLGQIVDICFIVWFVGKAIYKLLKIYFPKEMINCKLIIYGIVNYITGAIYKLRGLFYVLGVVILAAFNPVLAILLAITGVIDGIVTFIKWLKRIKGDKGKVDFPGVTPNKDSWDYIYNQSLVTPLTTQLTNKQNPIGNNITINSPISIDASGLTPEEAAEMIAMAQAENNDHIINTLNKNVANSKF